jgi:hypothetical protein
MAWYPASSNAFSGNFSSGDLSSCKHTISGLSSASHLSRTGSRPLTPFTLYVAIFNYSFLLSVPQAKKICQKSTTLLELKTMPALAPYYRPPG